MKVAINGFGRIGRSFLRSVLLDPLALKKINIVVINIGPANPTFVAHMFKYDTIMGTYPGKVHLENYELLIDDYAIKIVAERDPENINWDSFGIDWVVESSGKFTHRQGAEQHIKSGAKAVLITAPAKEEDVSIVPGVNQQLFNKELHKIVSLGSCTTNALVPMLKVLHDAFTITQGFMTTMHSYTNSQVLLDVESTDLRRSRAAALNIIPTTTGASKVLGKIIPELDGIIKAVAVRVPVAKVSLIDLVFSTKKTLTIDAIHEACIEAAQSRMAGILGLSMEPLVSSDFSGSNYSVVVDGLLTTVQGDMGKVFGWYDNEWGYSMRLKDFLSYVEQQ